MFIKRILGLTFFLALNRNFYNSTQQILKILKRDNSKRIINIVDNQMTKNIKDYPKKLKFFSEWTKQKVNFHKEFEKKMKAKRKQKLNFDHLGIE